MEESQDAHGVFCVVAKTSEQALQPVGTDGAYALYRLASLPHLGQALFW